MWIRKCKTRSHRWTSIVKAMCPKIMLIEQLGTSLPVNEHGITNSFWVDVFGAYREFSKSIHSENTEG